MGPKALFALTRGAGADCQDHAAAIDLGHAVVLIAADGAGGVAGSERAARTVVERIEQHARGATELIDPLPWVRMLAGLDAELSNARAQGETTVVVCAIDAEGNCGGASVGDSSAWVMRASSLLDLTAKQKRAPLLGTGRAVAVPFFHRLVVPWTLLVATDGLFKYAARARILECMMDPRSLDEVATELADAVRLPSGAQHDDIGLAMMRVARG